MGRKYLNVFDARAKGSLCTFQLPVLPIPPIPGVPTLPPLPQFPPPMPTVNLFCPFDEADEVVPTS